ncbi:MAG: hypothetical protein ABI867_45590 [Kofleriaceae bacterium]
MAVLALVACTRASEPTPDPVRPDPPPVPAPVTPKQTTQILLEQHGYKDAQASYLAVTLAPDPKTPPRLAPLGTRPALVGPAAGYYKTVVAQDANWWVHAIDGNKLVIGVMSATSGGKPSYQLALGFAATGLHVAGNSLWVGSEKAVGWIDLSAAKPTYVELVKRDGYAYKAYDRFVRDGDRLLAIDDEVMPMFADWFSIDGAGRPVKRLGDWEMPGVINGHYDHAALLATAANEWTLYLVAPYSVMTGNGQDLAAVPIRKDALVFDKTSSLQNNRGKLPVAFEQVDDRGQHSPDVLVAGTKYSAWTGMALAAGKIVLAAGPRGLLTMPTSFTAATRATVVALGGDVHDVRAIGGQVYALVGSELVVLDANLAVLARFPLPAAFDQFVD